MMMLMMAQKKVGGSSKNGRDSIGKRLGLKKNHLQATKSGQILIRQIGMKYKSGLNTYLSKNYNIHSAIDGIVKFYKYKSKTFVSVINKE